MRNGAEICWHDCNNIRVDQKCPDDCEYSVKSNGIMSLRAKTDSQSEYIDVLKVQMTLWINKPQKVFADQIPFTLAESEEGKQKIIAYLKQFKINPIVPLKYIKERLNLDDLEVVSRQLSYEDKAEDIMQLLYTNEWYELVKSMPQYQYLESNNLIDKFSKFIASHKILKKISNFDLVSSALNKERNNALVYFDINNKYDLTINLQLDNEKWILKSIIAGSLDLINSEQEALQQVAVLLSKNETSKAFDLLSKYANIYLMSSDFEYYWGIYYTYLKNSKKAEIHFLQAVILDPAFIEAKYNYALLMHSKAKMHQAKKLYQEILNEAPTEPKTLNNLASMYIDEKEYGKAAELLNTCISKNPDFDLAKQNLERIKEFI